MEPGAAPPRPSGLLRLLTRGSPTNTNMLLFRTLNREMRRPHANADHLAPLLLKALMPGRTWWRQHVPGARALLVAGLEHKKFGAPGVINFVDARTSWMDAVMTDALTQHGIRQVVIVAAGYDTRAFRLGGPDVRFYEVDLPHASKQKQVLAERVLRPAAEAGPPTAQGRTPAITYLAADLAVQPLSTTLLQHAAGFDASAPTLFTLEGLLYYLPQQSVRRLLREILTVAAPGSLVAFDTLHDEVLEGRMPAPPAWRVTAASVAAKGEPFLSGMPPSAAGVGDFLASCCPPSAAAAAADTGEVVQQQVATGDAAAAQADTDGGADGNTIPAAAAAAAAAEIQLAAGSGGQRRFVVRQFLGPREMAAAHLPHLAWPNDGGAAATPPPLLSFYSFLVAGVEA